jgi:hypothetical protein
MNAAYRFQPNPATRSIFRFLETSGASIKNWALKEFQCILCILSFAKVASVLSRENLPSQLMVGPDSLTCCGSTLPSSYRQSQYRRQADRGTQYGKQLERAAGRPVVGGKKASTGRKT